MRLLQSTIKKHHLTSQKAHEVLGKINPDTFTHARHDRWTATPSIEDFAKLHPERAVRVSFCDDTIIKEFGCLLDALDAGEYRYNNHFPLSLMEELANEALIIDLVQIVTLLKIENYTYEYEETQDEETREYTLIATFVFKDSNDAIRFKRASKYMGFCVVEDGTLLD